LITVHNNKYEYTINKQLVYIGNQYERDDIIDKYIKDFSNNNPYTVRFYGNWKKYPDKFQENLKKWPFIQYYDRVSLIDFKGIYNDAVACPLIAKKEYLESGFMTARLIECLYFGTIPIGLSEFYGIEEYLPYYLIINEKNNIQDIVDFVSRFDRNKIALEVANKLKFMDISNFIKKLGI
jgi:hypothetical protein